ncbi:SOS response-associated peptidase [Actinomyces minihominis]|uniref:SOS response-associated peptidase n=1 Tax=Actinomyces minihominis TaxID=2002838 RepID=UPI000C088BF4|nr:SOS response-associated peptidase [Actinomyces minihominis]
MCGRFTIYADDDELVDFFEVDLVEGEHLPSYNQAPSQQIRVVRQVEEAEVVGSAKRELVNQKWGFVPFWAKEGFRPLINARSETVTEKPTFRTAAQKRRSLVPMNGYYEWRVLPGGKKQPYFLSLGDAEGRGAPPGSEPLMAVAGIFEWPAEGSEEPATSALLTRSASRELAYIHDRMPLFIPKNLWSAWLDPDLNDRDAVSEMIAAVPPAPLVARMVSPAVGNVRNNFPGLINPFDPDEGTLSIPS